MRIAFMGTPEFAVPSLEALLDSGYSVVGAFTQPDRPAGRGHKLAACPVKQLAVARGVPVYQFERLRRPEGVAALEQLAPDLVVTCAFGQILSQKLLDIPRLGTVNVHASLLPKHRGAAPIAWSIMMGDAVSGVTTMVTDAGLDTGDMLLARKLAIGPLETAGELGERLSRLGAELLIDTLRAMERGDCPRIPQAEAEASYEPMLTKEMGRVDWTRSAQEISLQVRGLNPWPGAFTHFEGGTLKLYLARPDETGLSGRPGEVLRGSGKSGLVVACGQGALEILELQAPGGKRMGAKPYLVGKPMREGTILGGERAQDE